jgi:fused signal recognition particle receptor
MIFSHSTSSSDHSDHEEALSNESQGWFSRLKRGLSKSSSRLTDGISSIFTKRVLDQDLLDQLEELLIMSDMGVTGAQQIISQLARERFNKEITIEEVRAHIAHVVASILDTANNQWLKDPAIEKDRQNPQIVMVCGVNGNGKTTTIGKIAAKWHLDGHKVALVACDTFRAAAVEQLEIWSKRANVPLFKGKEQADPASVAYSGVKEAIEQGATHILIDTAGRLHNKSHLMDELSKIKRVLQKLDPSFPQHVVLVLDATTGQNALSQVKAFTETVSLTGLVVTKLDGTAKAGVMVALHQTTSLPIYAIGVGEGIDDLRAFNAKQFADQLVEPVSNV